MANANRFSQKEAKRKPKDAKRLRIAATKKRWKIRSADYWNARSILQYVEYCGVIYCATYDGILFELSEMLDGKAGIAYLERYHRAIEIGVERNMFKLEPDDANDPRCWGLWAPPNKEQSMPTPFQLQLILAKI